MKNRVVKDQTATKKIYLSRSSIDKPVLNRVMVNEQELEDFLSTKGFEIVHPHLFENEQEKISYISKASTAIGIAGSGTHNSILMPEHSKIVQIVNPYIVNSYNLQKILALVCGHTIVNVFNNNMDSENPSKMEMRIDDFEQCLLKEGIL